MHWLQDSSLCTGLHTRQRLQGTDQSGNQHMSSVTEIKSKGLSIELDEHALTAVMKARATDDESPIAAAEIWDLLAKTGIDTTESVNERVHELVQRLENGDNELFPFLIAEGIPPVDGEDGKLIWDERFNQQREGWDEEGTVSYYDMSSIVTVRAGDVLGKVTSPIQPVDGRDVKGERIRAKGTALALELDETVRRDSADPCTVTATIDGRVRDSQHLLRIEPVLHVPGDVAFESGNISSSVDVYVCGRICDRFEVKSRKSVTVCKSIEAARVTAAEDITVQQGIVGRRAGLVTAVRDLGTKHASEANIITYRDLRVAKQLMNSQVCVGGSIYGPAAKIIGGCVFVANSIDVATLGSCANVPTRIVAGVDPETVREMAVLRQRIAKNKELVKRIRIVLKKLENDSFKLTDEQKKTIAGVSEVADKAKDGVSKDESTYAKISSTAIPEAEAKVKVGDSVFPKVSIRIGDRETFFHKEFKGPIVIEKRKIDRVTEMIAVNQLTGSITKLKSERKTVDDLLDGFELEQDEHSD